MIVDKIITRMKCFHIVLSMFGIIYSWFKDSGTQFLKLYLIPSSNSCDLFLVFKNWSLSKTFDIVLPNVPFLCPLKSSEQFFPDVSRGIKFHKHWPKISKVTKRNQKFIANNYLPALETGEKNTFTKYLPESL